MNIYDISRKAGVSIATVSRVINGSNNVSEKTKTKVLTVIDEVGFTPNAFARGLGLNSMQIIGILCADSSDPYISNAIYFLERELRESDYNIFLCCTGHSSAKKQKDMQFLLSKNVDAIILVGSNFIADNDKENDYIRKTAKEVPVILVNGVLVGENIYNVLCDDYKAVYETTQAFIQSGMKNITFIHNALSYSGLKKNNGYTNAMLENNLTPNAIYITYDQKEFALIKDYLVEKQELIKDSEAIICANDSLAVGVLKYANQIHLDVPSKLQITGYDNSFLSRCTNPELSTIDNQLEVICINCVSTLMGIFNKQTMPSKTVFPGKLIQRETTLLRDADKKD